MNFKFNINNYVKVKLTDRGMAILKRNHEELDKAIRARNGIGLETYKPNIDSEGYYNTQMWSLIEEFGESIGLGRMCAFETNIICCKGEIVNENL